MFADGSFVPNRGAKTEAEPIEMKLKRDKLGTSYELNSVGQVSTSEVGKAKLAKRSWQSEVGKQSAREADKRKRSVKAKNPRALCRELKKEVSKKRQAKSERAKSR